MSSSSREPRQVPAPPNPRTSAGCTRFIPREKLQGFASWQPVAFGLAACDATAVATATAPRPQRTPGLGAPTLAGLQTSLQTVMRQQVADARNQGYQDGYRDGLAALESFKQAHASQVSAQVGQLLASLDRELGEFEQQIAASVARVATELARQVVRSELSLRPAVVVQVANEAVNAVLASARQITVTVNPDDHALVAAGCEQALAARGARLLSQASVARGGCRVESDAGSIDARIASRWAIASRAIASALPWDDSESDATETAGDA